MAKVVYLYSTPFQDKLQQSLREIRPDYTIATCLGQGSFGIVYEIQNREGDTLCLKVLVTPGTEKPKVLHAVETLGVSGILEREKYPQTMHHPNLVDVIESISLEIDDVEIPCVVQKKIEGPTLEEFLKTSPPADRKKQFGAIAQGIAAGVGAVHAAGIAHRDLKPDNIKLDVFGTYAPRIFDFSIAERIDDQGRIAHKTPAEQSQKYSAPETREKREGIDARRADVWSMGMLFYKYLTGENSPVGKGIHSQEQLLPRRYRAIINKCLQQDPEKRYKDGNDVYNALRQAEWYYATRATALIGIPAVLLALTALPLGVDALRLRMVSEYTNNCITAVEARALEDATYSCRSALWWDS